LRRGSSGEKPHSPGFDFVNRAHDFHSAVGPASLTFGRFGNLRHSRPDITFDCLRQSRHSRKVSIKQWQRGQDSSDQQLNPRELYFAIVSCFQRGTNRTAPLVAQYDEQQRVEMCARVLQTGGYFRREDISRHTYHKQVAETGVKNQFRWNS
jgi:hypothetical protein